MKLENLQEEQLWDCGWRLESILRDKSGLLHCIGDARPYPIPGWAVGRSHDEDLRQRPQPWVEQRVVADEVAANDMGSGAVSAVPNHRQPLPRRWLDQRGHGSQLRRLGTAHPVTVAVRQDDDVTSGRSVPLAVKCLDPGLAAGNHMEQDHAFRAWCENSDRISGRQ
jgi:hypothetical protein